ncbi:MAG TPA: BrnA antitoxin family protein [Longimicrobium sp.]|nr:BrnA antitoxin family protein [Longimicrobium sp.]
MRDEYDFSGGVRGALIPTPPWKQRITIRLDEWILDWFREKCDRAGGGNYQTMINEALREHIERERAPLEETLRRVIREELARESDRPAAIRRLSGRARRRTEPPSAAETKARTGRSARQAEAGGDD